jgi:uncharacterized heparinase superfamily protein
MMRDFQPGDVPRPTTPKASRGALGMLYLNTIRQLEAGQLGYLITRRVRRRLAHARASGAQATLDVPRLDALSAAMGGGIARSADVAVAAAAASLAGQFSFLGRTRTIRKIDWGRRYGSPLWSFHLQYGACVEDLAHAFVATHETKYVQALADLVLSWIAAEKPLAGDAWAPYVVSRRLLHWMRAFLLCRDSLDAAFAATWVQSIAMQALYLARNVEWHLRGNHVEKNLHAVFCSSALFSGVAFRRVNQRAARLLWRELHSQVLPDGMHYERSPMYHADVLRDFREAAAVADVLRRGGQLNGAAMPPAALQTTLQAMTTALAHFTRPDGTLHLFNDAANDPAYPASELLAGVDAPQPGRWSLPDAGYYGFTGGRIRLVIDCGEPGPRHQPAHAHCDLLSYELDADGVPFIVDSGTSGYDEDPLRMYMRSTRAHNTIQVADIEQHELWGTFRVARRGQVRGATLNDHSFTGACSPFHSSRIVHERRLRWTDTYIDVVDWVRGSGRAPVRSFIHIHPAWDLTIAGLRVYATNGSRRVDIELRNTAGVRLLMGETNPAQGWYASEFGAAVPAPVLEVTPADSQLPFGYRIELRP